MKSRKRGQLSAHFHWIFILIAGAIILTFFVSIVVKQKDISEQKIAGTVITGLDQILIAASITENTVFNPEIPRIELEFTCRGDFSEYSIKKTGINKNLGTDIIFSPDLIKGKSIIMWSLPWSMPFKIDNFLMITSPEVRYIIIHDNIKEYEAEVILDDLPELINKDITSDITSLTDENNYKIKLIFVTEQEIQNTVLPDWMAKQDVSAVRIADNYVQFYEVENLELISDYTTQHFDLRDPFPIDALDPMLYGAIFAENFEMYKCAMKKTFKRLELTSRIYEKRIQDLLQFYDNTNCEDYYIVDYYNPALAGSLTSHARNCIQNQCNFDALVNKAVEIETNNIQIARLSDCPLIY